MKKINKAYLKSLNPCKDRWQNYLTYYSNFSGSVFEFLELENISWNDKKWVLFREDSILPEKLMREFALLCACRAVDGVNIPELSEYFNLILFMFESGEALRQDAAYWAADRAAYRAADRAAYRAADRAADLAAYRAADRAADWAADWAADRAAYRAADRAADRAAYRAAEVNIQKEILINLCEEYL